MQARRTVSLTLEIHSDDAALLADTVNTFLCVLNAMSTTLFKTNTLRSSKHR